MTTNTWTIAQTDYVLSEDGLTNVINNLHWRLDATESSGGKEFTAGAYGTQSVTADPDNFIDYSKVTEANCIAWVKAAMGADAVTALEAQLQGQIDLEITPTSGTGTPWAA
jgi:hypothetical protein